jgi:hypothetical protein
MQSVFLLAFLSCDMHIFFFLLQLVLSVAHLKLGNISFKPSLPIKMRMICNDRHKCPLCSMCVYKNRSNSPFIKESILYIISQKSTFLLGVLGKLEQEVC